MDAARATLARLLAAGRFSGVGTGGAAASAEALHGGAAAAVAAAPGVDPTPSAMAGKQMQERRGSRRPRFMMSSIRLILPTSGR